jgi:YbbR domain-containing protein
VSGAGDLVSQVQRGGVYVDLAGLKSTVSGRYQVSPETATGNEVTGRLTVRPDQVHITVAIKPLSSFKTIPVLVSLAGQPKPGYGVVGVTVTPSQITATGSPTQLGQVSTVRTDPVSLSHHGAGTFKTTVPIHLPKEVHGRTQNVQVQVKIAPVQSSASVEIGIQPQSVAPGLVARTKPARVLVTLIGPSTALRGIARSTQASVNLTGYGVGTFTITPKVTARKGVKVDAIYPRSVAVELKQSP